MGRSTEIEHHFQLMLTEARFIGGEANIRWRPLGTTTTIPAASSLSFELPEVGVLETTGLPLMAPVRLPETPRKRNRYAFEPFGFSLRTWHPMKQVQEPPGLHFDSALQVAVTELDGRRVPVVSLPWLTSSETNIKHTTGSDGRIYEDEIPDEPGEGR